MKPPLKDPVFLFGLVLIFGYSVMSVAAYQETKRLEYIELFKLSFVAAATVMVVSRVSIFSGTAHLKKIEIDRDRFLLLVFSLFGLISGYIILTAPGVPLLAWVSGADPSELVIMREEFLKARVGVESILPYLNSVMAGVVIPYAIAEMFVFKHKWRWPFFLVFFVYCVLFIEKVFFFKAVLPLAVVILGFRKFQLKWLIVFILSTFAVVFLLGYVSGFGSGESPDGGVDYFASDYRPSGTLSYLAWRAFSVPLFTAADTLSYFSSILRSDYLFGATTGTISTLFGQERVYLERDVFAYQWGQTETGTGSSNSVYFVDAYVNFGYWGVLLYSLVAAWTMKAMVRSDSRALVALWPLFFFGLYVSGLIGNLIGGGFLLIIVFSIFFKIVDREIIN